MTESLLTILRTEVRASSPSNPQKLSWALVQCACGSAEKWVRLYEVTSGGTKSCGCHRRKEIADRSRTHGHAERHGLSKEFKTWSGMKYRCSPGSPDASGYADRGISVCKEHCEAWRNELRLKAEDLMPYASSQYEFMQRCGVVSQYMTIYASSTRAALHQSMLAQDTRHKLAPQTYTATVAPRWAVLSYWKLASLDLDGIPVELFTWVVQRAKGDRDFQLALCTVCQLSSDGETVEAWLAEQGIHQPWKAM